MSSQTLGGKDACATEKNSREEANQLSTVGTISLMFKIQKTQKISQFPQNHTIRKVKFLSKNSIWTKPQHFNEFFTRNFFDNFSREIKVVNS